MNDSTSVDSTTPCTANDQ